MEIIEPQPKGLANGGLDIWPTLGPQVCDFLEERFVYGPGPIKGEPYKVRSDLRYMLYRAYEHYPEGYMIDYGDGEVVNLSGRRHFSKVVLSLPKGSAKTELMALVSLLELHPDAPIRFDGYDPSAPGGLARGRSVVSPFIPLLAPTKDQLDDLAYGVAKEIAREIPDQLLFDVNNDRIMINGEGESKILPVAANAGRLDGLKPTFQCCDEPLALDTPVPTTVGWKTIGSLQAGDHVYDRWGKPVRVLGKSAVHTGRDCYRVTFKNGESVVTDGSHRWKAINWSNRPGGEVVVTTKEMLDRGLHTSYGLRWRLPRGCGYGGEVEPLDIDPYLLGLWLGDGSRTSGYISIHKDDIEDVLSDYDFKLSNDNRDSLGRRALVTGWRSKLREKGFLFNKHIPDEFALYPEDWKKKFIAGLIDSDGFVLRGSSVTFVQSRPDIANGFKMICESLGFKCSMIVFDEPRAKNGLMCKVHLCPTSSIPAKIKRKKLVGIPTHETERPAIVNIEKVDSVPVQCIEVDNDDHLFVFGKSGYLTHNTHRLLTDRHHQAVQTMENNLKKRYMDDPWQLSTTTAGDPSEPSVAKAQYDYGMKIHQGKVKDPRTFFYHRGTSDENAKFDTMGQRLKALKEASGEEAAQYRDLFSVAAEWDEDGVDKSYLERVWCNRWVQSSMTAFDADKFRELGDPNLRIPRGSAVTLGFDGAVSNDSTGIVMTEISTGVQNLVGLWERPEDADFQWRVPVGEVHDVMTLLNEDYNVLLFYGDPPYWQEAMSTWESKWGNKIIEWPTRNINNMYYAIRAYEEAIDRGDIGHDNNPDLIRHVANAGKNMLNQFDDEGKQKFRLTKISRDRKFDAAMAAILSWQARLDAIKNNLTVEEYQAPRRIR